MVKNGTSCPSHIAHADRGEENLHQQGKASITGKVHFLQIYIENARKSTKVAYFLA